jgi:hypothetical protein
MLWLIAGGVASVLLVGWVATLLRAAARADREAERAWHTYKRIEMEAAVARACKSVRQTLLTPVAVEEEYRRYLDAEEAAQEFVEEVTA